MFTIFVISHFSSDLMVETRSPIADLAALTGFAKIRSWSLGMWETSGTAAPTSHKADLILAIYAGLTVRSPISI